MRRAESFQVKKNGVSTVKSLALSEIVNFEQYSNFSPCGGVARATLAWTWVGFSLFL